MTKLTVARALTAFVATRMIRIATIVGLSIFAVAVLVSAVLSYLYGPWWWLLLVPFTLALAVFLFVRLIVMFLIRRIHTSELHDSQRTALSDYTDKIQRILEARATPLPVFALITVKDLILHRDITTIRALIADTSTLKDDYAQLERMF